MTPTVRGRLTKIAEREGIDPAMFNDLTDDELETGATGLSDDQMRTVVIVHEGMRLLRAAACAEGIPESFVLDTFKPEILASRASFATFIRAHLPQSEAEDVIADSNRGFIRKIWNDERLRVRAQTMPADEAKAEAAKARPRLVHISRAHSIAERALDLIDDRIVVEIADWKESVIVFFLQSVAMGLPSERVSATCNLH